MTPFVYRRTFRIEWEHCDPAGIVFNPRFFQFFDTSTWQLLESALGVARNDMYRHFSIFGLPAVDTHANFMRPLKFGAEVEIVSTVTQARRASFTIEHRIFDGGELSVEGGETRVWAVARADDPEKITAATIPAEVLSRLGVEPAAS